MVFCTPSPKYALKPTSDLSLVLTHRFSDGSAVLIDENSKEIYLRHGSEGELHLYDEDIDTLKSRIKMRQYEERPMPGNVKTMTFSSLNEAGDFADALDAFDELVEYVIFVFSDRILSQKDEVEAREGFHQMKKDDIIGKGYAHLLGLVYDGTPMSQFLDMEPEDIIASLKGAKKIPKEHDSPSS